MGFAAAISSADIVKAGVGEMRSWPFFLSASSEEYWCQLLSEPPPTARPGFRSFSPLSGPSQNMSSIVTGVGAGAAGVGLAVGKSAGTGVGFAVGFAVGLAVNGNVGRGDGAGGGTGEGIGSVATVAHCTESGIPCSSLRCCSCRHASRLCSAPTRANCLLFAAQTIPTSTCLICPSRAAASTVGRAAGVGADDRSVRSARVFSEGSRSPALGGSFGSRSPALGGATVGPPGFAQHWQTQRSVIQPQCAVYSPPSR